MGTTIIAEAGVNHNGSIELALELVDVAAKAGADYVKFQTFRTDKLASPKAGMAQYQKENTGKDDSQINILRSLELSKDDHVVIRQRCLERGIEFLSAPFDLSSVDLLCRDLALPVVKIPSGEITNGAYLHQIARYKPGIILSTGMATLDEIALALDVIAHGLLNNKQPSCLDEVKGLLNSIEGKTALLEKVTILHCTSEYPAPMETINLRAMDSLREKFRLPVGLSDHSVGISIPIAAVAMGAVIVEKHITLDKNLPGPDHKASIEPDELCEMVRSIRDVELAIGTGQKSPFDVELETKKIARKGLFAVRDIAENEIIAADDVIALRPEQGASPMMIWDIVGKPAVRSFAKGEPLEW